MVTSAAAGEPATTSPPRRRTAGARITLTLAALGMLGPFTINTVFPAFSQIGEEFGASDVVLQQLISVYLASFAVMSVFHGPLSDALGRKRVMLTGLAIYVVAMLGATLATGMGALIALRVLQGVSAGAATIVSRVVVRDLFSGAEAQRLMARVMMIFALAPVIAPVLGGWLLLLGDWRWVFAGVGLYGILVMVLTALMPESLPREARIPLRLGAVLGSLWEVGRSPMMLRIALATAFGFAAHFVFVAAAPIIVVRLLGLGEQDFWVLFGPLIIGMMAGSLVVGRAADVMDRSRLITIGYLGTLATSVLNLVLVLLAPDPGRRPRRDPAAGADRAGADVLHRLAVLRADAAGDPRPVPAPPRCRRVHGHLLHPRDERAALGRDRPADHGQPRRGRRRRARLRDRRRAAVGLAPGRPPTASAARGAARLSAARLIPGVHPRR
jgi:DHA1 family bicyclomycin/chloramphenicol resistance-like MFS transporter